MPIVKLTKILRLKNFSYFFIYLTVLFSVFIIEYIYLLPSPTGDDKDFINLTVNICNNNSFLAETTVQAQQGTPEWKHHGFFGQFLFAKLNYFCDTKIYYLLNFFVKFFTQIFLFLIFVKFIKTKSLFFILIATLCSQLYTQFRPETFSILIYFIIIYFFLNEKFIFSGIFFAVLYYSQPTIFFLFSLIFIIFFYKKIFINFLSLSFGSILALISIIYFYQYSFFDYLIAPLKNSGSYELHYFSFERLLANYILNKKAPFFIFYFFLVFIFLFLKKKHILLSLPFLIYFGPFTGMHEYNLIAIIPFFLFLFEYSNKREIKFFKLIYLFIIVALFTPYITRNFFTILFHGNNFTLTSNYIKNNIDNLRYLPEFIKYTNPEVKLKYKTKVENKFFSNDFVDAYAVNGSRYNCETLSNKNPEISIFGFKLFSSNTSYDIYLCKIR
jgi:hypothetical protein